MELDVHIVREVNCSWGFTLVGGNDSEIPLTVIKVVPHSPADRAGLQNGDTVLRIEGQSATEYSHAAASNAVSAAEDSLVLGVVRGLYDPVLDDFEPIYEPIDQEDSDQISEPTEVPFKVAEFIDVPPPLDSRSLTASPFVTPTKPYRPFSTEPVVDVPPLEDPIILNPNYKDNFPKHEVEDILLMKPDIPPERKFKLPISEQYDPEGKRIKKLLQESSYEKTVEFKEEKESSEDRRKSIITQREMKEKAIKEDAEYMKKMKKEIDLEKIEMTASEIVEESIQKATSVAREIKSEMISEESVKKSDVKETKAEMTMKSEMKQEVQETKFEFKGDTKVVSDLVELIDKTTDEIIKQSEMKGVRKEVEKFENTSQQDASVEERKLSTKQEIEETIEAGTVRRKSAMFASEVEERKDLARKQSGDSLKTDKQESRSEVKYQKETKTEIGKQTNGAKISSSKLSAEQRAYTLGLQTIPKIRGSAHSSYHYNLLLKTFFIHLTDVMVALSRFILTEPVFTEDKETVLQEKVSVSETVKKEKAKDVSQYRDEEQKEIMKKEEMVYEKKKILDKDEEINKIRQDVSEAQKVEEKIEKTEQKIIAQEQKLNAMEKRMLSADEMLKQKRQEWREEKEEVNEEYDEEYYEDEEFIERRRKTGAEMAQMAERKSAELMEKLDAVITEFQTKAGIEETDKSITTQKRTRSRSRSKAQERTVRESEPLEVSSRVGRESHEITEIQKTEMSSLQSYESKKMERRHETRELKTPIPPTEDGKVMYVAIVESHVYTNPEAIIEEVSESTETTMTQESMESSRIDRVAMESSVKKEEVAETVIQRAQEIQQKTVEVIQPIQIVEDIKSVQTRQATTTIEISTTDIAQSSEVSIEEVKDEVLKIKEPPVQALEVVYEASAKTVAESTEAYVEEVKTEALEITQPKAIQAKEIVETAAKTVAEASEVSIEEVKHEEFEVEKAVVTQAAETVVENKATAVAEATSVPVKLGKTYDEACAELKIVKFVPTEVEPVVVISEVELALHKRDAADHKIYESVIGVETDVQENKEYLDVSPVASFKSVGESKIDKTIKTEEVEEVPVQIIEKTEVAIEGLDKTEAEKYQAALMQQSVDQSYQAKAIILNTEVDVKSEQETQVEQATSIKETSFEAKSVSEESFEAKSVSEASLQTKSVVEASFEAKSTKEASFEAKTVSAQNHVEKTVEKTAVESVEKLAQQKMQKEVTAEEIRSVKQVEGLPEKPTNASSDSLTPGPETPVTDEYMFKLEIPLPKSRGTTPVPRDCTPPDDEDPHIVKKKLVPKIDTKIESYTYEPPLPTPPAGQKLGSPEYKRPGLQGGSDRLKNMRYIKPGLRGGSDRPEFSKEEIMEIERKSSLLASAIDQTLKSIEEYKEEVGIESKKEISKSSKMITSSKVEHKTVSSKISSNSTVKESAKEIKESYDKEWKEIEKQVRSNDKDINELSINVTIEEANGKIHNGKANNDERVQIIEVEVSTHNGNSHNGVDKTVETKTENGTINIETKVENGTMNIETRVENGTMNNVNETITKTSTESQSKDLRKEATEATVKVEESKTVETVQNGQDNENINEPIPTQNGASGKLVRIEEPKEDPMALYRPVKFDPEEIARRKQTASVPVIQEPIQGQESRRVYTTDTGEIIGTHQGIVDGLEEAVVDVDVAKALGKPGMPDEKIAELISGEAEMLREAHVMGLARVLSTHMHRADDDSSVDFQKIKPVIESLKDSEVLKALNEEVLRMKEQKKKEEKKWTTFLQKPKRPVPRPKYGYYRYVEEEEVVKEPYKVKIVKQPKPRIAPDYKPEDFDTGPLPWEQPQPDQLQGAPVEPEEPILIPEEEPEFLEAVDPLPESEVPDLEDTGIPLPPPPPEPVEAPSPPETEREELQELDIEAVVEETEQIVEEMEGDRLAQQLLQNVQKMVDPTATLEQQLAQMRAQIAALAHLPGVIQQTLDLVTRQILNISHQEPRNVASEERQFQDDENVPTIDVCLPLPAARKCSAFHIVYKFSRMHRQQHTQVTHVLSGAQSTAACVHSWASWSHSCDIEGGRSGNWQPQIGRSETVNEDQESGQEQPTVTEPEDEQDTVQNGVEERMPMLSEEELARRRQQEEEMMAEQQKIEKQRKIEHWNKIWPWGDSKNPYCRKYRINFMKYEKPPVSLDHLQRSEVYKVVHDLDETPLKRVETRTPVIAEADYRERCRSISPYPTQKHVSIPQQLHP